MAYASELLQRRAARLPPPEAGWGAATPRPSVGEGSRSVNGGALPELAAPLSSVGTASSGSYDSADEQAAELQRRRPGARLPERRRGGGGGGSGAAALRQLEEKRVCNGLIKRELGVRLAFPTYREGLAAIAAGDLRPFE
jgi:hypothetical protein